MNRAIDSLLILAVGIIFTSGCSKENISSESENKEITLYAYLPDNLTKTYVDSKDITKVNWLEGDAINVWGGTVPWRSNKFTLTSGAGTIRGTFGGYSESEPAWYALYPYNINASKESEWSSMIETRVPSAQIVSPASYDPDAAIMVGTASQGNIFFHHAVAYLRILTPSDAYNYNEIIIETNDGSQLTGDGKFNAADGSFTPKGDAYSYVKVLPKGGVFASGAIYYAAVIPGTYAKGLTVRYRTKNDYLLYENKKSSSNALTLAAGTTKILGVAQSFDHSLIAYRLWENGPYWASTNIGAENKENYGKYFAWGDVVGQTWNGSSWSGGGFSTQPYCNVVDHNDYIFNFTPPYDAARLSFGGDWRMPTDSELQSLINNCTRTWITVNGVKGKCFTGTGAFSGNSIFIPAAGYGDESSLKNLGAYGYVWSTTLYYSYVTFAKSLYFFEDGTRTDTFYRAYGLPIRPVSD